MVKKGKWKGNGWWRKRAFHFSFLLTHHSFSFHFITIKHKRKKWARGLIEWKENKGRKSECCFSFFFFFISRASVPFACKWRRKRKDTTRNGLSVVLFVFLSLVSRFHSLRSFHCKRAKQRERERDTTVDDS